MKVELFDFHSVGHEPADRQGELIKESLDSVGLSLGMLVGFSRDSPTVMESVERKLVVVAEGKGSRLVVGMPCHRLARVVLDVGGVQMSQGMKHVSQLPCALLYTFYTLDISCNNLDEWK